MKKQTSDLYDVHYHRDDVHIGYANRRSDKTRVAYASPDEKLFEGRTRTEVTSEFIKLFR